MGVQVWWLGEAMFSHKGAGSLNGGDHYSLYSEKLFTFQTLVKATKDFLLYIIE